MSKTDAPVKVGNEFRRQVVNPYILAIYGTLKKDRRRRGMDQQLD
jgi:hypothetical protein